MWDRDTEGKHTEACFAFWRLCENAYLHFTWDYGFEGLWDYDEGTFQGIPLVYLGLTYFDSRLLVKFTTGTTTTKPHAAFPVRPAPLRAGRLRACRRSSPTSPLARGWVHDIQCLTVKWWSVHGSTVASATLSNGRSTGGRSVVVGSGVHSS